MPDWPDCLGRNLALAAALCEAWELGYVSYPSGDNCVQTPSERCIDPHGWAPGIGRLAPRGWIP